MPKISRQSLHWFLFHDRCSRVSLTFIVTTSEGMPLNSSDWIIRKKKYTTKARQAACKVLPAQTKKKNEWKNSTLSDQAINVLIKIEAYRKADIHQTLISHCWKSTAELPAVPNTSVASMCWICFQLTSTSSVIERLSVPLLSRESGIW